MEYELVITIDKQNILLWDRIARVQRELMQQSWWGSLPWTWQ